MNILLENTTGASTRAETVFKAERGKTVTVFKFECKKSALFSPYTNYNDPIYNGCVCEVFIAYSADVNRYIEIEVAPNGTIFYALITNKKNKLETQFLEQNFSAVSRVTDDSYVVEIAISNEILPLENTIFNAFRIETDGTETELQSLIPTLCESFHRPNFFRPLYLYIEKTTI